MQDKQAQQKAGSKLGRGCGCLFLGLLIVFGGLWLWGTVFDRSTLSFEASNLRYRDDPEFALTNGVQYWVDIEITNSGDMPITIPFRDFTVGINVNGRDSRLQPELTPTQSANGGRYEVTVPAGGTADVTLCFVIDNSRRGEGVPVLYRYGESDSEVVQDDQP